jgi:cell division ATPase FtsA
MNWIPVEYPCTVTKKLFLATRSKNLPASKADKESNGTSQNEVVVDDISYLDKKFKAKKEEEQKVIDSVVQEFSLNEEQERAFRIVANKVLSLPHMF